MKKILVMTLALLASSIGANAALVWTAWDPAVGGGTGLYQTNGDINALLFNQFNGPGTLVSVEFELTGYAEAGYEVVNDIAGAPLTFTFTGVVDVNLANPLGGSFVVALPAPSDVQRTVADGDTYSTPGYPVVRSLNDSDTVTGSTSNPLALAMFIGGGTISLDTYAGIDTQFNADNDGTSSVVSRASADGQIRYLYDDGVSETPEPTSMVLGGSALLGIGLLARRRAAKK